MKERESQEELEVKKSENIIKLFRYGTEIAGGVTGAVIGLITANPILTVVLGGAGAAIGKALTDTVEKQLSNREKVRVSAASVLAIQSISDEITKGNSLRQDGFFEINESGRSAGEEVFEGMLLSAKNEHEEKKIKYISNIFVSTVFNDSSIGEANYILKLANDLTYRQICLLSLFQRKNTISQISLGKNYLRENSGVSLTSQQGLLRSEVMDLYNKELITMELDGKNILPFNSFDIVPDAMRLTSLGEMCFYMMELELITDNDLIEIGRILDV